MDLRGHEERASSPTSPPPNSFNFMQCLGIFFEKLCVLPRGNPGSATGMGSFSG